MKSRTWCPKDDPALTLQCRRGEDKRRGEDL
jgi:hypothetical protein